MWPDADYVRSGFRNTHSSRRFQRYRRPRSSAPRFGTAGSEGVSDAVVPGAVFPSWAMIPCKAELDNDVGALGGCRPSVLRGLPRPPARLSCDLFLAALSQKRLRRSADQIPKDKETPSVRHRHHSEVFLVSPLYACHPFLNRQLFHLYQLHAPVLRPAFVGSVIGYGPGLSITDSIKPSAVDALGC